MLVLVLVLALVLALFLVVVAVLAAVILLLYPHRAIQTKKQLGNRLLHGSKPNLATMEMAM